MMMMASFSPVFGDWEIVTQTGLWEIAERTHWKENRQDTIGWVEWGNNITDNFAGYYGTLRFPQLETAGTGFWFWENYAITVVKVRLNFTGSDGKQIIIGLEFERTIELWGAIAGQYVFSEVRENPDMTWFLWESYKNAEPLNNAGQTEVIVYRDGTNLTVKVYVYQDPLLNPRMVQDITFNVGDAWFTAVSMNIAVNHEGFHPSNFNGYLENEVFNYTLGELPTPLTPEESIINTFFHSLINEFTAIPTWLRDEVDQLYGWLSWLMNLSSGILWQITSLTIPLIPVIVVFWGFDVTMTAINTGSIQPIGDMVLTIWNLTISIIGAIVGTMSAIWSFVKFW